MAQLRLFQERVAGNSPSKAGFTVRGGGRSVRNYIIGTEADPVTTVGEIHQGIIEMMGDTGYHSDNLRIKRTLPLADPEYYWMFCEGIGDIAGIGRPTLEASDPSGSLEAPPVDYVATYPQYGFSGCTFSPRPYAVVQDEAIPTTTLEWRDVEGTAFSGDYAMEWLRFVDVETIPGGEYITAQAGQFLFDVNSGLRPDGVAAGAGQLRMFVAKKTIKMTWFQVPYAYIDPTTNLLNTYIGYTIGKVNQYDWWKWEKGTLLLEGVMVNRYTPIVPVATLVSPDDSDVAFSTEKLCDITFMFSHVNPPLGKDSADAAGTPRTPSILSSPGPVQVVQQGHNYVPYAHQMGWFYAKTNIPGYSHATNRPIYPSMSYHHLFTNPAAFPPTAV